MSEYNMPDGAHGYPASDSGSTIYGAEVNLEHAMTGPLTHERKQEIRERIERATPGQWQGGIAGLCNLVSFDGDDISGVGIIHNPRNLVFIAHARADLPDLLESHEALVEALAGLLSRIDHFGPEIGLACFHAGIKIPNIATEAEAARAALRNAGVQP